MSLVQKIDNLLTSEYSFIRTALLFGSYASSSEHNMSDIDIAIECDEEISFLMMGDIVSFLEASLKRRVDLVILNDIYKKSPLLAYNIYKSHKKIFVHDREKYQEFKLNALHYYMDFKPIIEMHHKAFSKRIQSGNLAKTQTA